MASFQPNSPTNLTMVDMATLINSLGGPAKNCRFVARILPEGPNNMLTQLGYNSLLRDLTYLCEATEFPGRGFDFMEARYYGPPIYLPYNTKYSNELSMSFLCRAESYERQIFDDWMGVINPINIFDFNYAKDYYCTIDIYQLAEYPNVNPNATGPATAPKATYMWSLKNAWPMQVNPQPVNWADADVLRMSVTFTYQYWVRPGRDSVSQSAPSNLPGLEPPTNVPSR